MPSQPEVTEVRPEDITALWTIESWDESDTVHVEYAADGEGPKTITIEFDAGDDRNRAVAMLTARLNLRAETKRMDFWQAVAFPVRLVFWVAVCFLIGIVASYLFYRTPFPTMEQVNPQLNSWSEKHPALGWVGMIWMGCSAAIIVGWLVRRAIIHPVQTIWRPGKGAIRGV